MRGTVEVVKVDSKVAEVKVGVVRAVDVRAAAMGWWRGRRYHWRWRWWWWRRKEAMAAEATVAAARG